MPYEGHCPRAFIVICQDTAISTALEAYQKDVGIVAQTMLLRAAELGLGGCMIGSFQKNALHEVLKLSEKSRAAAGCGYWKTGRNDCT